MAYNPTYSSLCIFSVFDAIWKCTMHIDNKTNPFTIHLMKKLPLYQTGFSLLELSITLVIIGLVLAAIASGAHLMQAAQINKVTSELSGYKQAVENFQLKYHNLPGDQPNASNFWPSAVNGNGDGQISGHLTERLQAWSHLAKSHMIAGNFTGLPASSPLYQESINVPGSTIKGAYYILGYDQVYPTSTGRSGNNIQLVTTVNTTEGDRPEGGALPASDARIIDKKLDETPGPAAGTLYVLRSSIHKSLADSCVTGDYTATEEVDFITDDNTASCRLLLWLN
jgi:prepilin-type N-terminal cleavage/methylation domain-containing protein